MSTRSEAEQQRQVNGEGGGAAAPAQWPGGPSSGAAAPAQPGEWTVTTVGVRGGRGMRIVIEAKNRRKDSMLSRRGRRPDSVQIQLVRMHPHQAGEEIQAICRIIFSFVESSTVSIKGSNDVRVGVRKKKGAQNPPTAGEQTESRGEQP